MRLRDVTVIGSSDDLKRNLTAFAERLESAAQQLYSRRDLDTGCRVYPRIARSTADQLKLLAHLIDEPIEIAASICRTVFEINVTFRYCLLSSERLNDFATQRGADEISIYKSIKRFSTEGDQNEWIAAIDRHIEHHRDILRRHKRPLKPDRPSLKEMVKAVGVESDYDCLYGLYSKYVHASAWFVLGERDHIDFPEFRQVMWLETQKYAGDTLSCLEELAAKV